MNRRTLTRALAVPTTIAAIGLGLASPAYAHVGATADSTAAGAHTVVTISVPHGCDGSPTTEVAVQIPEGILSVVPTRQPYYDVEKRVEKLDEPVTDAHGNEFTERVASVVYTATTPLPEGQRDALELSLQLPDSPGETLAFPAVQTCEEGETAWTEIPAEGQDASELERPAPSFVITEADGAVGHDTESSDGDGHGDSADNTASANAESSGDGGATLGWIGAVLGALGLGAGGAALAQVRRRA